MRNPFRRRYAVQLRHEGRGTLVLSRHYSRISALVALSQVGRTPSGTRVVLTNDGRPEAVGVQLHG